MHIFAGHSIFGAKHTASRRPSLTLKSSEAPGVRLLLHATLSLELV